MDNEKDLLIASAALLYSIGVDMEAARERLRILVEQGVSYDSEEMKQAYCEFMELDKKWKDLKKQHLTLRDAILKK